MQETKLAQASGEGEEARSMIPSEREAEQTVPTPADLDAFFAALDEPPPPTAALRAAFERRRRRA